MLDKQFDDILSKKLSGLKTDKPADWAAFKSKLDATAQPEADEGFDSIIKDKLENHSSTSSPQWDLFTQQRLSGELDPQNQIFDEQIQTTLDGHVDTSVPQWDLFIQQRLSGELDPQNRIFDDQVQVTLDGYVHTSSPQWDVFKTQMDDRVFDQEVNEHLDDYEHHSQPDWNTFKEKYDSAQFDKNIQDNLDGHVSQTTPQWDKFKARRAASKATAFDATIATKVGQISKTYNSQHWILLRDKLRLIASLRKQVTTFKGMEALFVAAMLFTFTNFLGFFVQPDLMPARTEMAEAETQTKESQKIEKNQSSTSEEITSNSPAENSAATIPTRTEATNRSENNSNRNISANSTNSNNSNQAAINNTGTAIRNNNPGNTTVNTIINSPTEIVKKNAGTTILDESKVTAPQALNSLSLIQTKGGELWNKTQLISLLDDKIIEPIEEIVYNDKGHWLHVFGAMENNYITTPAFQPEGFSEATRDKYGYRLGLMYSYQNKRMEYEIGLGYATMNYQPHFLDEQVYKAGFPQRAVTFDRVYLDVISIPMRLKYHFIDVQRWTVFGHVGLQHDLIANMDYRITDNIKIPGVSLPGQVEPPVELPPLYEREFTTGIWGNVPQGLPEFANLSTKSNNYMLRGALGLGAERNISDNFSAYIRAEYAHTLYNTTLGPLNDKVHRANFGMGFKMRLK